MIKKIKRLSLLALAIFIVCGASAADLSSGFKNKDTNKISQNIEKSLTQAKEQSSKKYEVLDDDCIDINMLYPKAYACNGCNACRIRATAAFTTKTGVKIEKGTLGGYVNYGNTLDQSGTSWIGHDAIVCGEYAKVSDDAQVYGNARICGENIKIYDHAQVYGKAVIAGPSAQVYGNAKVYDDAKIYGEAKVYGDAQVYGEAEVYNSAEVFGTAKVYDNAKVYEKALVSAGKVRGKTQVSGDTVVDGK